MASKMTNAEKQRAYRARKKAEKNAALSSVAASTPHTDDVVPPASTVASSVGDDESLQVQVQVDETPAPKLSLKERLLQKVQGSPTQQPAPKKRGRSKKEDDNLLVTVAPTVLASLIATYSQQILPDEYKACAPTKEEVSGVLGPLMAILARRVEIVGKASQDAIDLMNSLICGFMYGTRAYITYTDIKKQQQDTHHGNTTAEPRNHPATHHGLNGHADIIATASTNGHGSKIDAAISYPTIDEGDSERGHSEASLIAHLFERDKRGRAELGLLPRTV